MSVTQTLSVTNVPNSIIISSNTSQIRILWHSTQSGDSWNGYERKAEYYVSVNGGTESKHVVSYTLPKNSTVTIVDTTIRVQHKADGSGTVRVRTWMDTSISAGVVEKTATLTLPQISRVSTVRASDRILGETCSVTWTPAGYYLSYKLKFSIGSWSYTTDVIRPNTTTAYTYSGYTLPLEVANQLPNTTQGTMSVTLTTYSDYDGQDQVGTSTKDFRILVPGNALTQPTVGMSLSPSNSFPSPYNSLYIQRYSKVKATLDISTKYGATEAASNITVEGNNHPYPYESGFLSQAGTISVKATVKDSRGYYGTSYEDIEVIPYQKPYVTAKSGESSIIAARCDGSANLTDSGTYLKIKAKVVYSKVISGGVQNNYGNIKYRYRAEGGSYSPWQTILDGHNSDEVITPPLLDGDLDTKTNYQVQIVAYDDLFESDPITIAISSDAVYMHKPSGGNGMGIGGYSSGDGNLDIYFKTMARGGLSVLDDEGNEIPLDSTLPIPRGQVTQDWNPDNLVCGIYVVANNYALKTGDTVIMYNGVLLQMKGDVGGNVKIQLALPVDENRNPMYRLCWYSNWSNWRSMKL